MIKRILPAFFILSQTVLTHGQSYTSYLTGSASDVQSSVEYGVCLMGGATEDDNPMSWLLEKAIGGDVVVIRASGSDGYNNYLYNQLGVSVNSVETIVFNNSAAASDPYVLQQLQNAELIWIAGGDQAVYESYWKDTQIEDILNAHVNTKQAPIGGTSAGMAILAGTYFSASNGTITSSQALANPFHPNVTISTNFLSVPLLGEVTTDTHFDNPDRKGRLMAFLARQTSETGQRAFGIACDEYTAVCIDGNGLARVFGAHPTYDDNAYFLQANCDAPFEPEVCSPSTPLTWNRNGNAVKVYAVKGTSSGSNTFDLNDWETGVGGNWQHWYVQSGVFTETAGTEPNCGQAVSASDGTSPPEYYWIGNELFFQKPVESIRVFDSSSRLLRLVFSKQKISLEGLPQGLYVIQILNGEKTHAIRAVIR